MPPERPSCRQAAKSTISYRALTVAAVRGAPCNGSCSPKNLLMQGLKQVIWVPSQWPCEGHVRAFSALASTRRQAFSISAFSALMAAASSSLSRSAAATLAALPTSSAPSSRQRLVSRRSLSARRSYGVYACDQSALATLPTSCVPSSGQRLVSRRSLSACRPVCLCAYFRPEGGGCWIQHGRRALTLSLMKL